MDRFEIVMEYDVFMGRIRAGELASLFEEYYRGQQARKAVEDAHYEMNHDSLPVASSILDAYMEEYGE